MNLYTYFSPCVLFIPQTICLCAYIHIMFNTQKQVTLITSPSLQIRQNLNPKCYRSGPSLTVPSQIFLAASTQQNFLLFFVLLLILLHLFHFLLLTLPCESSRIQSPTLLSVPLRFSSLGVCVCLFWLVGFVSEFALRYFLPLGLPNY